MPGVENDDSVCLPVVGDEEMKSAQSAAIIASIHWQLQTTMLEKQVAEEPLSALIYVFP